MDNNWMKINFGNVICITKLHKVIGFNHIFKCSIFIDTLIEQTIERKLQILTVQKTFWVIKISLFGPYCDYKLKSES